MGSESIDATRFVISLRVIRGCLWRTLVCPLLQQGDMAAGSRGFVLVICGCTNSGKSTVAKRIEQSLSGEGKSVQLIGQDDYYMQPEKVAKVISNLNPSKFYYNYDVPESVDIPSLIKGNMITEIPEMMEVMDKGVFLITDQKTCLRRRLQRNYDPPDEEGYFDQIVWPEYVAHLRNAMKRARTESQLSFVDVSSECDVPSDALIDEMLEKAFSDSLRISDCPLDIAKAQEELVSPSCGAVSIFVGTTRDNFHDRAVTRLDYECYDEMAYSEMRRLCSTTKAKFPRVEKMLMWHRVGEVPVTETSIIIAASSPHRQAALEAVSFAIDAFKATVPIWKKEMYADGGCSWKENAESIAGRKGVERQNKPDQVAATSSNEKKAWLEYLLNRAPPI
ncbi:unnamed protein product, partial [Mesorhabditis spiculigera]